MVFPSIFRANVQVGSSGQSLSVANGAVGVGLSDLQMASVGANNLAVANRVVVGAAAPDATNDLHVAGVIGVTTDLTVGVNSTIGGSVGIGGAGVNAIYAVNVAGSLHTLADILVGANLDVTSDGTISSKLAVGASEVDGSNVLHVVGDAGVTVNLAVGSDVAVGANLDVTSDATIGNFLAVNAAAVDGSNDLHVVGRAGITGDLYLGGDLFMSGGLQLPQLQSEVITLANSMNAGAANGSAMAGSNIPTSGMLLVMVAANTAGFNAPAATFVAAKPQTASDGVVTTLHSGGSTIGTTGSNATTLEMAWNTGAAKPVLFYSTATNVAGVDVDFGVSTFIGAGPTPA